MYTVSGIYHLPGRSQSYPAKALLYSRNLIQIVPPDGRGQLRLASKQEYRFGDVIPGVTVELIFSDGAIFIPDDHTTCWPPLGSKKTVVAWLECHWITALAATLIVPLFLWVTSTQIIPVAADASISLLPDSVAVELGKQTLEFLDQFALDSSRLEEQSIVLMRARWQSVLQQLNLPKDKYWLYFRDTELGANAMALPDGSIIVTDDIVNLMAANPDAITAVLLHEIAHVEFQHGIKQLARSTAISLLFAVLFGDLDVAAELILGISSNLLKNAYSRDMEREADHYAHQKLTELGLSPNAFADAIRLLVESDRAPTANQDHEDLQPMHHWLDYLSSHPSYQERIESAITAGS